MYPNAFYRVSVKALIKDEQGKVLVVKENQATWSLPGGGLDHGEDPRQALLRELQEELGIARPTIQDIAAVQTFYLERKSAWLLWVVYKVTLADHSFTPGKGVSQVQFMDPAELAESTDIFEQQVLALATGAIAAKKSAIINP